MQVAEAKQSVHNLVETLPNSLLPEVISFILFIKMRDEMGLYKDLEALSISSTDFWNNEIDDEVWPTIKIRQLTLRKSLDFQVILLLLSVSKTDISISSKEKKITVYTLLLSKKYKESKGNV